MVVKELYEKYPYPYGTEHGGFLDKFVMRHIKKDAKEILDAGCGTGNMTIALARHCCDSRVTGCDFSDESLKVARELACNADVDNLEFLQRDFEMPLRLDGRFDFAISLGCLHHIPNPELALKNICSSMMPGGAMIIAVYGLYGRMETELRRQLILSLQEKLGLDITGGVEIYKKILASTPLKKHQLIHKAKQGNLSRKIQSITLRLKSMGKKNNGPSRNLIDIMFADQFVHPVVHQWKPGKWAETMTNAGFNFTGFIYGGDDPSVCIPEDAMDTITDAGLRKQFETLSEIDLYETLDLIFKPSMYFFTGEKPG